MIWKRNCLTLLTVIKHLLQRSCPSLQFEKILVFQNYTINLCTVHILLLCLMWGGASLRQYILDVLIRVMGKIVKQMMKPKSLISSHGIVWLESKWNLRLLAWFHTFCLFVLKYILYMMKIWQLLWHFLFIIHYMQFINGKIWIIILHIVV